MWRSYAGRHLIAVGKGAHEKRRFCVGMDRNPCKGVSFVHLPSKTAVAYYNCLWGEMQAVTKSVVATAMLLPLCFATSSSAQQKNKTAGAQVKAATIRHMDDEALRLNAEVIRTTTKHRIGTPSLRSASP